MYIEHYLNKAFSKIIIYNLIYKVQFSPVNFSQAQLIIMEIQRF